jgi:hypothetical protein
LSEVAIRVAHHDGNILAICVPLCAQTEAQRLFVGFALEAFEPRSLTLSKPDVILTVPKRRRSPSTLPVAQTLTVATSELTSRSAQ